jgi:hypothetical protein
MHLPRQRLQGCYSKGFRAVVVDHLTTGDYSGMGFPATAATYQQYYQWMSGAAHSLGLAFGIHGGMELFNATGTPSSPSYFATFFDFASTGRCWQNGACGLYSYMKAGRQGRGGCSQQGGMVAMDNRSCAATQAILLCQRALFALHCHAAIGFAAVVCCHCDCYFCCCCYCC